MGRITVIYRVLQDYENGMLLVSQTNDKNVWHRR
jgi:hypothetical protein